jgi:predicted RNA methylase
VKEIASAMHLDSDHVSNGYHPYLSTKHGVYLDKSANAQALQQFVRDGGAGESDEQRQRRTAIENLVTKVRGMQLPGFFPTPPKLAELLVDLANIQPGDEVLEPSAGIGSLAEAIRDKHPGADLTCVEQNADLVEVLRLKGFETIAGDFLKVSGQVHRIVMNPPYERRQDAEHVLHAFSLLAPGGRLVALTSVSLFQADDAKCVAFRQWFDDVGATRFATLEDAFNNSDAFRQTGVTVAVILADL